MRHVRAVGPQLRGPSSPVLTAIGATLAHLYSRSFLSPHVQCRAGLGSAGTLSCTSARRRAARGLKSRRNAGHRPENAAAARGRCVGRWANLACGQSAALSSPWKLIARRSSHRHSLPRKPPLCPRTQRGGQGAVRMGVGCVCCARRPLCLPRRWRPATAALVGSRLVQPWGLSNLTRLPSPHPAGRA